MDAGGFLGVSFGCESYSTSSVYIKQYSFVKKYCVLKEVDLQYLFVRNITEQYCV